MSQSKSVPAHSLSDSVLSAAAASTQDSMESSRFSIREGIGMRIERDSTSHRPERRSSRQPSPVPKLALSLLNESSRVHPQDGRGEPDNTPQPESVPQGRQSSASRALPTTRPPGLPRRSDTPSGPTSSLRPRTPPRARTTLSPPKRAGAIRISATPRVQFADGESTGAGGEAVAVATVELVQQSNIAQLSPGGVESKLTLSSPLGSGVNPQEPATSSSPPPGLPGRASVAGAPVDSATETYLSKIALLEDALHKQVCVCVCLCVYDVCARARVRASGWWGGRASMCDCACMCGRECTVAYLYVDARDGLWAIDGTRHWRRYPKSERLDNTHAHARAHTHAQRDPDRQSCTQVFKVRETAERELQVAHDRIRALERALNDARQVEARVLRAPARESVCLFGAVGEERARHCR